MNTPKQVLDKIIIGMPDDDRMKDFIIMAMEQYAKLYHKNELKKLRVGDVSGLACKCGNQTFTHRHTNWIECTACNKIKVLQA